MNEILLGYIVLKGGSKTPIVDFYCQTPELAKSIALFKLGRIPKGMLWNRAYAKGAWASPRGRAVVRAHGLKVHRVYAKL